MPGPDKETFCLDQGLKPAPILRAEGEVIFDDSRLTIQQEVIDRPLLQHLDGFAHVVDKLHL
ncbi:hypothetical protein D3C73_1426360 [compost metagenome]